MHAQTDLPRPSFGRSPEPGSGSPAPAFSAVADHHGGIAGYVNTELIESGGPAPSSPDEAVRYAQTVKGEIFEVFDTNGEIVGYFASGDHGFISAARKDVLVGEGFRLLRSPKPDLEGGSPASTRRSGVVPPTTPGPSSE